MKNTKLELFNSLTNDNQFIVLFIGKNSQYNDMVQRVYNLHWNSIVTTFNLDENRCGISANQFNELENYRKVFPIGIEDSENRKNLFNKKKLTPISVVSCIEKKQAQYKRTLLLTDLQSKSTKDLTWLSIFQILVQMLYLSIDVMNRCVIVFTTVWMMQSLAL